MCDHRRLVVLIIKLARLAVAIPNENCRQAAVILMTVAKSLENGCITSLSSLIIDQHVKPVLAREKPHLAEKWQKFRLHSVK